MEAHDSAVAATRMNLTRVRMWPPPTCYCCGCSEWSVTLPSAVTSLARKPRGAPAFDGHTVTVTWSPGFRYRFDQPYRLPIMIGGSVSAPHSVTFPLPSLTSKVKYT